MTNVYLGPYESDFHVLNSSNIELTINISDNIASATPYDVNIRLSNGDNIVLQGGFTFLGYYILDTIPSPITASVTGTGEFLIEGGNFDQNCLITIDGNECPYNIIDSTTLHVNCIPMNAGIHYIEIGSKIEPTYIKYVNDITYFTPVLEVSSISSNRCEPPGGKEITIYGVGFDVNTVVKIGNATAEIVSFSDTELVFVVPPNQPGKYVLNISKLEDTFDGVKGFKENPVKNPWTLCSCSQTGDELIAICSDPINNFPSYVYKSFNRAETWEQIATLPTFIGNAIKGRKIFSSPDLSKIFCVGEPNTYVQNRPFSVIYSIDGGITWQQLPIPLPLGEQNVYLQHYYTSNSTDHQVCIIIDNNAEPSHVYTLYVSHDYGQTWTPKYYAASEILTPQVAVISDIGSDIVMLKFDYSSFNDNGGWVTKTVATKSTDGGTTWSSDIYTPYDYKDFPNIWDIAATPDLTKILFAGDNDVYTYSAYESLDGGNTWNTIMELGGFNKAYNPIISVSNDYKTQMITQVGAN